MIKVVHGAPLSGKTSYVKAHADPKTDVVFDYDKILEAISFGAEYERHEHLHETVLDIRRLIIDAKAKTVWIITTYVSEKIKREVQGHEVEYIKIEVTPEEAKRRLNSNGGGRDKELWLSYIADYFKDEWKGKTSRPRVQDPFYGSKRWKDKRHHVLKRDKYQCRECARYGKVTEAKVVHHIKPKKDNPMLKLSTANLISLCNPCHEDMHDKNGDRLSDLGMAWVHRLDKGLLDR